MQRELEKFKPKEPPVPADDSQKGAQKSMNKMNRAYSLFTIKSVKDDGRIIEGVASTPTPDRIGDIVDSMGAKYAIPIPLLWQHNADQPVGRVEFARPTKNGIPFRAKIESTNEPGEVKNLLDKAWQNIKLNLVRAVSIGFAPLKWEVMKDGGYNFTEWEWLELSLVTIPANAEATIQTVKSIDTEQRAASGRKLDRDRPKPPGVTGKTKPVKAMEAKQAMKTISEQILGWEGERHEKSKRMDKLMEAAAEKGETLDAAGKEEYDTLDSEMQDIEGHLVRLRAREKSAKEQATAARGGSASEASESRSSNGIRVSVLTPKLDKGIGFVRLFAARYMAKHNDAYIGMRPDEIAKQRGWGEDIEMVLKTAVAPGTTTDTTWAAPLVVAQNLTGEFIELLTARSIIPRIPGLTRVPFNVQVPRETTGLSADWVGQGSPKPLTKGALDTVTLGFNKVAAICVLTQELLKFSSPSAEAMVRDRLVKAITYRTDRDFLDPAKAAVSGVSPASITNSGIAVAATGTTSDAFRTDFANLLARYSIANYNLDTLAIIMTQTQAMRLSLMRNDFGVREFPSMSKDGGSIEGIPVVTSENIVATGGSPADGAIIVALNASDILLADEGGVEIDVSTEASVQMDTAPDSPATASTVYASFWQRNLVGVRAERFITWTKARTDSVVYLTGANYK